MSWDLVGYALLVLSSFGLGWVFGARSAWHTVARTIAGNDPRASGGVSISNCTAAGGIVAIARASVNTEPDA